MAKIDWEPIAEQIEQGFISVREHPGFPLRILNYTPRTQFEFRWTPETMMCRGLIIDYQDRIVARPFPKFFGLEQIDFDLPNEPFDVFEKMDGSLGILYWWGDVPGIATRGSFTSPQAEKATQIFREKYSQLSWDRTKTHLFEIIFPENRIVVNYGEMEDLVLLAVLDTETGQEQRDLPTIAMPVVKSYPSPATVEELFAKQDENREGYVLRFESGLRIKIKFDEYKRLHRLLTGFSSRVIWEALRDHDSVEPILEKVPDEFYSWVRSVESTLRGNFRQIEETAKSEMKEFPTRKETAQYFLTCEYPQVMFYLMDGKNYTNMIWKMVRPEEAELFKREPFN